MNWRFHRFEPDPLAIFAFLLDGDLLDFDTLAFGLREGVD